MFPVSIKRKQVAAATKVAGFSCNGLILALPMWLAMLALIIQSSGNSLAECQEQLTVESRQQKDKDLTETIDYLEKLDEYFSQIARPRFGRSGDPRRPLGSRFGSSAFRGLTSGDRAHPSSLIELINNRLAKKYYDSMMS